MPFLHFLRSRRRWSALVLVQAASIAALAVALGAAGTRNQPASQPVASLDSLASGIIGSKHDFTAGGVAGRNLCQPCHTPHITSADAPLLIRNRPRAGGGGVEFDETTLLCLSCHDGLTAPDVFASVHASSWGEAQQRGRSRLASHPVGTRYPFNRPDYASEVEVTGNGNLPLRDGRIQCITCHDPHNTNRHAGMLNVSNDRSRLCLTCHRI